MSIHAVPTPANGQGASAAVGAALRCRPVAPNLAALVAPAGAAVLVLDGEGERVLHASESAASWRSAVADASGKAHGSLGLPGQLRRLGPLTRTPRVVRLRLDPRGIAPAVPCRVARAPTEDGAMVVLVAPLAGRLRTPPVGVSDQAKPEPDEPGAMPVTESARAPVAPSPVGGRLVWRSDADGVLTQVSGVSGDLIAALDGRSWEAICGGGDSPDLDPLLTALREKRTFRTLPLTVRSPDAAWESSLDVSGAPAGRANEHFTGFSGFAIIRERRPIVERPAAPEPSSGSEAQASPGADRGEAAQHDPIEPAQASPRVADGLVDEGASGGSDPSSVSPPEPAAFTAPIPRGPAPDLSTDERAAFREIARALGARFADDGPRDRLRTGLRTPSEPEPPARAAAPPAMPATAPATAPTAKAVEAAFDAMPGAVLVQRDGTLLFANRRMLDLTGFGDRDALGRSAVPDALTSRSPSADASGEAVAVTTGTGETARFVTERSKLDWDGKPATLILARLAPESPSPARDEAPAVEDDPQSRLDRIDDGLVTIDADGHVLKLDPRAEAILADRAPLIVGRRLATIADPHGAGPEQGEPRLADPSDGGVAFAKDVRSDGSAESLRVRIGRLLSSDDTPLYATLQDMADAKRGEDTAAARDRADDDGGRKLAFFAEAGRNLRAPLDGILRAADGLLAEESGPLGHERYRDDVRGIHESGSRALGLLDDLIALAEIEAGRGDLAFAALPLNELVSRCIAELQPQAARRRIVLRTSLAEGLGALQADEGSLHKAAVKVLANAIRLTEPGGQVIVSTTLAERGELALRVRGAGQAMSPEEVDRVLDPFRHPRMPGSRGGSAPDLGLSLTRALVEANRGRLRITGKDEGTLVEMLFPANAARA